MPEHSGQGLGATHLGAGRHALPVEQEAHEIGTLHRLYLAAQALDRIAVDARQQVPLAPFLVLHGGGEAATQHMAFALQAGQGESQGGWRLAQVDGQPRQGQGAEAAEAGPQHFHQGHLRFPGLGEALGG
ncbi:hypothetical protein D3C72_1829600 [compost metagenome]